MELFLQGAAKGDSTEQGLGEQGLHRQQGKGSQNPQGLGLSLPQILQSQTPRGWLCSRGFWCQHRICPCYSYRDEAAPGLSQPPQVCPSPPGLSQPPGSLCSAPELLPGSTKECCHPTGTQPEFQPPQLADPAQNQQASLSATAEIPDSDKNLERPWKEQAKAGRGGESREHLQGRFGNG